MSSFYDALHFSVLKWVPHVNYTKSNFPSWFSKDLIDLVFLKRRAHAIFKSSRSPLDYREFSLLRAKYKLLSKNCYKKFIELTESQLCTNPKVFWKFIKKNKSSNDIPKTVHFNDLTSTNDKEVSDLFAKQFSSVYTEHSVNHNSTIPHLYYDLPSNCFFDLSFIESGLSKLSGDKSIGPDGLSGEFLYMLKSVLSYPLSLLFRKSLDEGIYPDILKLSTVKPIYKSGDKSNVANYRPISLLGHIAKLFDSLVLKSIGPAVSSILIDEQHGFRPGRSTNTCNIVFSSYVSDAFNNRSQVDVIYMDFSKAFDRVDHTLLIEVLLNSGFGEPLLSWLQSYLRDRKQIVDVHGSKSIIIDATSGVPQGGHLSPLLFAIFVNNIKTVISHSHFLLFADDLKLFLKIDSLNDCYLLQNDLNSLVTWANEHHLELNFLKCHSMSFYRTRDRFDYSYSINANPLKRSENKVFDLGITFDRELNFHSHLDNICCKALKMLGFIKRICNEFKLTSPIKTLYCAYVRSILEYGAVVWDPSTSCGKDQIERVQRKFLNYAAFILSIDHPPHDYTPILNKLSLSSLVDRRKVANLKFLRLLIDGCIDSPVLLSMVNFKVPCSSVRQTYPFFIPKCNTNYSENQPILRMMRLANSDPLFL